MWWIRQSSTRQSAGIVVGLGAGRAVDVRRATGTDRSNRRGTRAASRSPTKATPLAAGLGDVAAADRDAAVVVVDEDGVAADLVDEAILERAVFRAVEEDRAAAIDGPVAAQERLLVLHEGPRGVAEGQALRS